MNAKEINFAYKVRHALNENLDHLPPSTTDRLAAARHIALSRKKPDAPLRAFAMRPVLSGMNDGFLSGPLSWLGRMGVALPLVLALAGVVGMYQAEKQHHISELAEIDAMVLADELPLDAYLDHGFNAYLASRGE
jgi:hypothetical protein